MRSLLVAAVVLAVSPLAHADGPRTMGSLQINSTTVGAEVFVDGNPAGTTPLSGTLTLTAEEHTLKVTKTGFAPLIDVVKIGKHKTSKIDVDLVPVAGILRVKANVKEAKVFVDGKFVGEAPLEAEINVGARAVSVSHGGYKDFFRNVEAVAGQEVALEVTLEELPPELNPYFVKAAPPPKWYEKWWVWTVGVVVAGGVVTAGTVPIVESHKDPYADFHCAYCYTINVGK